MMYAGPGDQRNFGILLWQCVLPAGYVVSLEKPHTATANAP